jgi:hypothetical protein
MSNADRLIPPRLDKELRPLLLPWSVGALAGGVLPHFVAAAEFWSLFFFGSVLFLGASSLGVELNQRSLLLLLSQPCARWRLWWEKSLVLLAAVLALGLVHWRVQQLLFATLGPILVLFFTLFLAAAFVSSGFWIQTTQSLWRGALLGIASQCLVFASLGYTALKWYGARVSWENVSVGTLLLACVVYLAGFVKLGWPFWRSRVRILAIGIAFAVVYGWLISRSHAPAREADDLGADLLLLAAFLLSSAGVSGYLTLAARSTVGGMAFTAAVQFGAVLVLEFVFYRQPFSSDPRRALHLFLASVLFAVIGLVLGWRRFARLELRENLFTDGVSLSTPPEPVNRRAGWLACRPGQQTLNLLRKELRLVWPLFVIAAAYTACWLVFMALIRYRPQDGLGNLLLLATCFYVPLLGLLAGCISLGEEKALGLAAAQLTLPVPVRRQWLAKLGVGLGAFCILGLGLPRLLHNTTFALLELEGTPLRGMEPGMWSALTALSAILFVMGFWAATAEANTVRAALTGVLGAAGIVGSAFLGGALAQYLGGVIFYPLGFAPTVVQAFVLDPVFRPASVAVFSAALALVALRQSLSHFQREQLRRAAFARSLVVLGLCAAALTFVWADLLISAQR